MPRARKDGTPAAAPVAKELPPLDLSQLTATVVRDPNTMRQFKRTKGERSPEQRHVDNLVMTAHKHWTDAGKPDLWAQIPGVHLRIPEGQYETLERRIRAAGQHLDLAIRFGSRQNGGDGYAEVVMVVKDKTVKDGADGADPEDPEVDDDSDTNEGQQVGTGDADADQSPE